MTTIAVDLRTRQMASDSRVTSGNSFYETDKIFETDDGSLIGFCGVLVDALRFVEWMKAGAVRSALPTYDNNSFEALVLNEDGLSKWDSACVRIPLRGREVYAVGSGGGFAMGAMLAGAEIGHAVKIAIQCDELSGGTVVVKQYEKKIPRRRPRSRKPSHHG